MTTVTQPQTTPQNHNAPARPGRWGWAIFAVVAVAVAAGGWYFVSHREKSENEHEHEAAAGGSEEGNKSSNDAEAIPVGVIHMTKGGIVRTSSQIGTVTPYEDADLYAKVSGYLAHLHVDYGDHVKRDQLLIEIDDPEVVDDAKKAAADLAQAKAAVAQADAFIESAKADRDASASAVEQAEAEVERYVSMRSFHEKKDARYKDLVLRKAIPQQIADEEDEALESAKASEMASRKGVLNSKAQLIAASARVKKAEADKDEAKANVEVAEAKLERARVLVGYTKILSPYDGVITKRNFFRGAFIRSASDGGTSPLLTVARTDKVRVVTQVPDRDVPYVSIGDSAEITLDALAGEVLKGTVSRFAETEDPGSRTMHTEIDLPNPENKIRAGMYGIARIILDKDAKSSTLPSRCLVGEAKDGKADVYVVRDGRAKKTSIKVGTDDGLQVEVHSGLTADDEVIEDTGSVTDGAAVRVTKTTEPSSASKTVAETDHPAAATSSKAKVDSH